MVQGVCSRVCVHLIELITSFQSVNFLRYQVGRITLFASPLYIRVCLHSQYNMFTDQKMKTIIILWIIFFNIVIQEIIQNADICAKVLSQAKLEKWRQIGSESSYKKDSNVLFVYSVVKYVVPKKSVYKGLLIICGDSDSIEFFKKYCSYTFNIISSMCITHII